jgi:broad specificity phosphatase PhoE
MNGDTPPAGCLAGFQNRGRRQARRLGQRRTGNGITAVFSSDLARAAETASTAFGGSGIPVLHDWRLRECDYGQRNGMPAAGLRAGRREHLDQPYPGGESWRRENPSPHRQKTAGTFSPWVAGHRGIVGGLE